MRSLNTLWYQLHEALYGQTFLVCGAITRLLADRKELAAVPCLHRFIFLQLHQIIACIKVDCIVLI